MVWRIVIGIWATIGYVITMGLVAVVVFGGIGDMAVKDRMGALSMAITVAAITTGLMEFARH